MKAAVFQKANSPLVIEDRPVPEPKAGEVLIRVKACGICHSDLMVQQGYLPVAKYPVVPGHEVAGVVEKVGPGVIWPKVGDKAGMPWLFWSCGHCMLCAQGDEVLCPEMTVTGVNNDGGYQEFMIAPAHYVAPIPEGLDFAEAGPLMCAGLTVFNGMRSAKFQPGQKVAVIGLGGLGHLAVLYAKAMGARVAVISNTADKEAEAKELGAEYFINSKSVRVADALQKWDGGADIILATAPSTDAITDALPGLAPDGTLVVLGVGEGNIIVSPFLMIGGRRHLMGSPSGSRKDIRATLNFSAANHVVPRITKVRLPDANDMLKQMHEGKLRGRAVIVFD
jgi:D-arabinose 1-dehydrogenase-like Zn-dependent alcohol dehydrogenase